MAEVQEVLDELEASYPESAIGEHKMAYTRCSRGRERERGSFRLPYDSPSPVSANDCVFDLELLFRAGDTHPDEMYPLPKINKHLRRAHVPHTDGWHDCVELHETNVDGVYLPLAFPECGGEHIHGRVDAETGKVEREPDAKIVLENVDVVTPRGEAICDQLSVVVTPADTLMVTGRNASGMADIHYAHEQKCHAF